MPNPDPQLPWTAALRQRFNFETPLAFRALEARNLFRWQNEYRTADLSKPGDHYLQLFDMEWFPPDELRDFKFASYHKPGFIPFAHTGGGDYWCWYPELASNGNVPVLRCWRDDQDADLYAPDFAAALYRHVLDYADQDDDNEPSRSAMLARYAVDLTEIWPATWCKRVARVADRPVTPADYRLAMTPAWKQILATHPQVRWME